MRRLRWDSFLCAVAHDLECIFALVSVGTARADFCPLHRWRWGWLLCSAWWWRRCLSTVRSIVQGRVASGSASYTSMRGCWTDGPSTIRSIRAGAVQRRVIRRITKDIRTTSIDSAGRPKLCSKGTWILRNSLLAITGNGCGFTVYGNWTLECGCTTKVGSAWRLGLRIFVVGIQTGIEAR